MEESDKKVIDYILSEVSDMLRDLEEKKAKAAFYTAAFAAALHGRTIADAQYVAAFAYKTFVEDFKDHF